METIYLKANKNNIFSIEKQKKSSSSRQPTIYVNEIIKVWCHNKSLLTFINSLKIKYELNQSDTVTIPILSVIQMMEDAIFNNPDFKDLNIEIENLGDADITLSFNQPQNKLGEYIKVFFVCLIVFFGGAFAILSFNEDVSTGQLFNRLYILINGKSHPGTGVVEFFYSFGIMLGIIIFYNNFGRGKNATDPTPTEIKMNQYEEDVTDYLNSEKDKQNETHIIIDNGN